MSEQRQLSRRIFSCYMLVLDDKTGKLVGHWTDISPGGFRLETVKPIPQGVDFRFRVELPREIANKTFMVFSARSRWCHQDPYDSNLYVAGFQIANLPPEDSRIFTRLFERYGSQVATANFTSDYLWR
jgi:hypothetical protein